MDANLTGGLMQYSHHNTHRYYRRGMTLSESLTMTLLPTSEQRATGQGSSNSTTLTRMGQEL